MTAKHLTEMEIQQYALSKADCEAGIIEHAGVCKECQANIADYQLLFSIIKGRPKPVFDFDLQASVLPQLSPVKPQADVFLVCLFAFLVLAAIGIPAYLFRGYLPDIFSGMLPITIYLMLVTAAIILIFQGAEMFKKYKKQMDALNFH